MLLRLGVLALGLLPVAAVSQQKEMAVSHHARGTFSIVMKPLTPSPAEGLARYSINKVIHGDLEATTVGEMFSGGDPKLGEAGYVAIEVVTGTLGGKHGSFALQQFGTVDKNGPKLTAVVVPGSGMGELKGIAGTLTIKVEGGVHLYELEYTLPE